MPLHRTKDVSLGSSIWAYSLAQKKTLVLLIAATPFLFSHLQINSFIKECRMWWPALWWHDNPWQLASTCTPNIWNARQCTCPGIIKTFTRITNYCFYFNLKNDYNYNIIIISILKVLSSTKKCMCLHSLTLFYFASIWSNRLQVWNAFLTFWTFVKNLIFKAAVWCVLKVFRFNVKARYFNLETIDLI